MRRRSFIPTTANGNATNISDPKWVKLESDDGKIASIGPSNDDIPAAELTRALLAESDDFWSQYANEGAFAWDITRPLAEQWPWCDSAPRTSPSLTDAEAATIIEQSSHSYMPFETEHAELIDLVEELPVSPVEPREGWQGDVLDQIESPANIDAQIEAIGNRFAPVDTASREPWRADGETQSTGDLETLSVDARLDALEERLRETAAELGVTIVPEGAA